MSSKLNAAKSFVKKNKEAIIVTVAVSAVVLPLGWLAVKGLQYADFTQGFLADHGLMEEFLAAIAEHDSK